MPDRVRTVLRGLGELLVTVGVVVLLFCVYELQVTNLYTGQQQEALAEDLQQVWAAPVAPAAPQVRVTRPAAPKGAAPAPAPARAPVVVRAAPQRAALGQGFAVLRVPRLGGDYAQVVVEGVSVRDLKRGPGHIPGTALPGEVGNVVLSGHRTTYGAPFADLDRLRPGDEVVLETRDRWLTYRMTGAQIVRPSAVEVTYPVPGRRGARPTQRLLTLTTCHPEYSARERLIVRAELASVLPKAGGGVPPVLRAGTGS